MNIGEYIGESKEKLKVFASNQYVNAGKEFLQSNSIVAKFAFLILVLLLFMMLLSLGSAILTRVFKPKHDPILIDGMINSKQLMIIPQDPSVKGSKPIYRSDNERHGIEFTWSVWINIDDYSYKQDEYKHVFHKGNNNISTKDTGAGKAGINFPNNGPGLYVTPIIISYSKGNTAGLLFVMNSFNQIAEEVTISNIPLNKWVNIIIRLTNQIHLDVYINGVLVKRHVLSGVPKQNYGDVYASLNGGFSGNTSSLRYFEHALSTSEIQNIVNKGPNDKLITGSSIGKKDSNKYLSTRWFLQTAQTV
jgi:hypothetical protein